MSVVPDVSVIIPTYEEHETIASVIGYVREALSSRAHEIVVVDDSPDSRTAEAVASAVSGTSPVRILQGPGTDLADAVLYGFDKADASKLICMDGDGQHPPRATAELANVLEDVDMVFGSRHAGGRNHADWSPIRVGMSFGASGLAWAAVPDARRLQDPMSGMFGVRRSVVEAIRERLDPEGYKIGLELLARAPVDEVAEVPIAFNARGGGESKTDWRENVRYLKHLSRLAIAARRRPRPVRVGPEVDSVDA